MTSAFDRSAENVGNVIKLEHVNLMVPDQRLATAFYVSALGLTRDPYLMTGVDNMWINAGRYQFHLPTGRAQKLRGRIGLIVPDRDLLLERLQVATGTLAGTRFRFDALDDHVLVVCPWGNVFRCHAPDTDRYGPVKLGMPYLEFDVPAGSAARIGEFYEEMLGAHAAAGLDGTGSPAVRVCVGTGQQLVFIEQAQELPAYDGHHIQIYVADFSGPHRRLLEKGLITEESNRHQYRFRDITDLASGATLFRIEHEVRSLTHPLYGRTLVNRNPDISPRTYRPGHDGFAG